MITFGPIVPDLPTFLKNFSVNYQKFDYKENIINKNVKSFLNDPKKSITNVEEVTEYET